MRVTPVRSKRMIVTLVGTKSLPNVYPFVTVGHAGSSCIVLSHPWGKPTRIILFFKPKIWTFNSPRHMRKDLGRIQPKPRWVTTAILERQTPGTYLPTNRTYSELASGYTARFRSIPHNQRILTFPLPQPPMCATFCIYVRMYRTTLPMCRVASCT